MLVECWKVFLQGRRNAIEDGCVVGWGFKRVHSLSVAADGWETELRTSPDVLHLSKGISSTAM